MSQEQKLYEYQVTASCHGTGLPGCTRSFVGTDEDDVKAQAEATFPPGSAWQVTAIEKLGEATAAQIAENEEGRGKTGDLSGVNAGDDLFAALFGNAARRVR